MLYEVIAEAYLVKLIIAGKEAINDFIARLKSNTGYFFFSTTINQERLSKSIGTTITLLQYFIKGKSFKDRLSLFIYNYDDIIKPLVKILEAIETAFRLYNSEEEWNSIGKILAIALRVNIVIGEEYKASVKNLTYICEDSIDWHKEGLVILKIKNGYLVPFTLAEEKRIEKNYDMIVSVQHLIEYYVVQEKGIAYKDVELLDMNTICTKTSFKRPIMFPAELYTSRKKNVSMEEQRIYYIALITAKCLFNISEEALTILHKRNELIKGIISIIETRSLEAAVNFELYLTLQITSLESLQDFIKQLKFNTNRIVLSGIKNISYNELEENVRRFKDLIHDIDEKILFEFSKEKEELEIKVENVYGPLDSLLPESETWILLWSLQVIKQIQDFNKEGIYFGEFSTHNLYLTSTNRLVFIPLESNLEYMVLMRNNKIPITLLSLSIGLPPELSEKESIDRADVERIEIYHLGLLLAQLCLGMSRTELHSAVEDFAAEGYRTVVDSISEKLKKKLIKDSILIELIIQCLSGDSDNKLRLDTLYSRLQSELNSNNAFLLKDNA